MAAPTILVQPATGSPVAIERLAPAGAAKANAPTVGLAVEDAAYLDGIEGLLTTIDGRVDGLEGQVGIVTETAPGTDTAPSGLNGRMQRVAQRLTNLIALFPTNFATVGVKAASTAPLTTDPALVVAISPNSLNANGRQTPALSAPVVIAAESYETVAASQTAQVIGAAGASGDFLAGLLVIPETTTPGLVTILDNATSIPVFIGGTVGSLIPFTIPLGIKSASGAWKITTGANVRVIAIGTFT